MKLWVYQALIYFLFEKTIICEVYFASVETIQDHNIKQIINEHTEASCILHCQKDNTCSRIAYQRHKEEAFGNCLILVPQNEIELSRAKAKHIDVIIYAKKPCARKPCKPFGYCIETNGGTTYECREIWLLQASNVCYEAKGDKYGQFKILSDGILTGIKLVHVSGGLECCVNCGFSNFGCIIFPNHISVIITRADKSKKIMPHSGTEMSYSGAFFTLPGYSAHSKEVIFEGHNQPVIQGEKMKIWYGEDFNGKSEFNNGGKHCVDVYAKLREEMSLE